MSELGDLTKFLAPEVISGRGAHRLAGRSAANLGARRVLLVTDAGVTAAGWTAAVADALEEAGLAYVVFTGVTPNPKVDEVARGARIYREEGCNALVAVGGGSPIDCAKGIGVVAANGGRVADYEGIDRIPSPIPPLVCVPTTAGSAADVSQFAILSDPAARTKMALVSKALVPDLSLIDPLTLVTQPPAVTAATGMDALCHAFEAYTSTAATPIGDLLALEAVSLAVEHLPRALADAGDLAAREGTLRACLYAGLAFSNASLGAVHALAHALGGEHDAAHGACNAILLPHVVAWNFEAAPARYRRLGAAMGLALEGLPDGEAATRLAAALREVAGRAGCAGRLRDLGLAAVDPGRLAARALEDLCMATNPRCPTQAEVERLYEAAV